MSITVMVAFFSFRNSMTERPIGPGTDDEDVFALGRVGSIDAVTTDGKRFNQGELLELKRC